MVEKFEQASKDLIFNTFEIEGKGLEPMLTEDELFEILSGQIAYMIDYKIDFLLSLMYRMDISEVKINEKLMPGAPEPANIGLARLVIERQKQKIETKKMYKSSSNSENWSFDFE